jgi:putative FmdB family regulatory protein
MPTYEYACRECGEHLEVVQSFKDDPLTTCLTCGGHLRKVFSATGIIFKGSGYYVTDTRKKAPAESSATSSSSDSKSGSSDSKSSASAKSATGDAKSA